MTRSLTIAQPAEGHRSLPRRIERFLIGIGMSLVAWVLEKALLRTARRGEGAT